MSSLNSITSGDHICFLEGDEVHEATGDGCESLTGTCVIRWPRLVCVVATSNISPCDCDSLIFGIETIV